MKAKSQQKGTKDNGLIIKQLVYMTTKLSL